jgi:hypothetical protein
MGNYSSSTASATSLLVLDEGSRNPYQHCRSAKHVWLWQAGSYDSPLPDTCFFNLTWSLWPWCSADVAMSLTLTRISKLGRQGTWLGLDPLRILPSLQCKRFWCHESSDQHLISKRSEREVLSTFDSSTSARKSRI